MMEQNLVPRPLQSGCQVDVRKTVVEKVSLSSEQMLEITINTLTRVYDIPYGPSIKDGKLLSTGEVSAGSHSYTDTSVHRVANESDVMVLSIISTLKQQLPLSKR